MQFSSIYLFNLNFLLFRIEMRKILESNNYEYIGTAFEHQNTVGVTTDPCNCTAVDDFYLRKDKVKCLFS